MNPSLKAIFDLLETERLEIIEKIRLISPQQFNAALSGKWSIHQILAHVIAAERLSLRYMQKKSLGISALADSGFKEEIKMTALWLSQRLPFKFRAPRIVVEQTPVYPHAAALIADWSKERMALFEFLENFQDVHLKKKVYRHVRAGMLNIRQALLFFREHYLHHLPQIKRLL